MKPGVNDDTPGADNFQVVRRILAGVICDASTRRRISS